MSWQDWIRTVEVAPVLVPGPPDTVSSQVDALVRTGCRIFHLHVRWDLAELETARLVSPLLQRYEGVLELQIDGAPRRGHLLRLLVAAGGSSVTFELESVGRSRGRAGRRPRCRAPGRNRIRPIRQTSPRRRPGQQRPTSCGVPGGRLHDQLRDVRLLSQALPPAVVIQVGGGISYENARELYDAGARVLLVRTAIFGREDLPRSYRRLVQAFA